MPSGWCSKFSPVLCWLSNRKGTQSKVKPRLHDTTCCQTGCQTGLTTGCIVYTAGCQTGCTTRFDNRFGLTTGWTNSGCSFNTVVKPGCTTGLTTVLYEQLFVQHGCQTMFVKPVVQPGLTTGWTNSCSFNRLSSWLSKPLDNRLDVCSHDTAGCQTGCIV